VSSIRILLVGVPAMLTEIIGIAIGAEPDLRIVTGEPAAADIGAYTRRRRIDAVIFSAYDRRFDDANILVQLRANPRLCLLGLDGKRNRATLHRLAPSNEHLDGLAQATLVSAIRDGTLLRLR
jgi:hypothetical protein